MKLLLVIPCFNEEASLPTTISRLTEYLNELLDRRIVASDSQITFVDDGSSDATWSIIESASAANAAIAGIKLSRNRGHQSALLAGLLTVEADIVVSLDADLQDDVNPPRDETRVFSRYMFLAMVGYLAVISSAGTKIFWYAFPLFPLAAASLALLFAEGMSFVSLRFSRKVPFPYLAVVAMASVSAVVVARNLESINDQSEWSPLNDACNKFLLSTATREASKSGLAVFHPGYSPWSYFAPTLFYTKILEAEGGTTIIVSSGGPIPDGFAYVLTCSVNTVKRLERSGRVLETIAGADNIMLYRVRETQVETRQGGNEFQRFRAEYTAVRK